MIEAVLFLAGLLLGGGLIFVMLKKINQQREQALTSQLQQTQGEKQTLEQKKEELAAKVLQLEKQLTRLESENKHLTAKFNEEAKRLETQFENLATKIFEEKSRKFTEQNKTNLTDLLSPLKERIKTFEEKVEKSSKESVMWNAALKQQIESLSELNKQINIEAQNLTKALTGDSKVQGDWGELQLEMLLEKAGLEKEVHYTTQSAIRDEEGNLKRPDFIINLPEDKHLIIDSKVTLTAYDRFVREEDEDKKAGYLKQHLQSIREKIKDLSSKNYQDLYGLHAPDYVMMFIPIEPAFQLAVQQDDGLYAYALDKNIILVTTSTLLAIMRTVAFIWRQDRQTKHVLEIARVGGTLYDKFEGFTQDLIKVGNAIETTKKSYADAMNKLSTGKGNLVSQTERLKELGAKAKKSINPKLLDRSREES